MPGRPSDPGPKGHPEPRRSATLIDLEKGRLWSRGRPKIFSIHALDACRPQTKLTVALFRGGLEPHLAGSPLQTKEEDHEARTATS